MLLKLSQHFHEIFLIFSYQQPETFEETFMHCFTKPGLVEITLFSLSRHPNLPPETVHLQSCLQCSIFSEKSLVVEKWLSEDT